MDLCRDSATERRVRSVGVAMVDPPTDPGPGLAAGLKGVEADALVFDRSPEPFDDFRGTVAPSGAA